MQAIQNIQFPVFSGIRCLMMPYIQGNINSVPAEYLPYRRIIESVFIKRGDIGFLTIDESPAIQGIPHRGTRAKHGRPLHTEAGIHPVINCPRWGGGNWAGSSMVKLEKDVKILLANNQDNSCAVWETEYPGTSLDGDIGYMAHAFPYEDATLLKAGEVFQIGIFTPHESLPIPKTYNRQFLRIVGAGVHGREEYFTKNPLLEV